MAREWKWKKAALRKAARILAGLGVAEFSEEWLAALEKRRTEWREEDWEPLRRARPFVPVFPQEDNVKGEIACLLANIGQGSFDPDTGEWAPSSDRVLVMSIPRFDRTSFYKSLLLGLETISGGELCFADVEQLEGETPQEQTVRFTLNGHPNTFHAKTHYLPQGQEWVRPSFSRCPEYRACRKWADQTGLPGLYAVNQSHLVLL